MTATRDDPVLAALDELVNVLDATQERTAVALARAKELRALRERGVSYAEAVDAEQGPLIVEIMREVVATLVASASRFQREEARALWNEGLTMERIGTQFGISRQRVSDLLGSPGRRPRQSSNEPAG